jgi:hypothetical protein
MPKKPTTGETPVEPELPVAEHLHDETKRPLKAPIGGVPPNIAAQFPGKGGGKHLGGQIANKGRNFRHQGR